MRFSRWATTNDPPCNLGDDCRWMAGSRAESHRGQAMKPIGQRRWAIAEGYMALSGRDKDGKIGISEFRLISIHPLATAQAFQ